MESVSWDVFIGAGAMVVAMVGLMFVLARYLTAPIVQ